MSDFLTSGEGMVFRNTVPELEGDPCSSQCVPAKVLFSSTLIAAPLCLNCTGKTHTLCLCHREMLNACNMATEVPHDGYISHQTASKTV